MWERTRGERLALLMAAVLICAAVSGCATHERRAAHGAPADVLCGADVLKRDGYKILDGQRVALVTNQTGRDREGNRLLDLLAGATNVKLVKFLA